MLHPNTELRFINEQIGYGVFAKTLLPKGTITYVKDSLELEISPTDFLTASEPMKEVIDKYSYIDERGYRIVSWDFAKYVNHCCNCNTISTGYGFEIAIRDILPGEQITDEYGIFNIETEMHLSCCGYSNCRKIVQPSDFETYYQQWDEQIKDAIRYLRVVEQPLMPLLEQNTRQQLDAFFVNPAAYRSVYNLKYQAKMAQNGLHSSILKPL